MVRLTPLRRSGPVTVERKHWEILSPTEIVTVTNWSCFLDPSSFPVDPTMLGQSLWVLSRVHIWSSALGISKDAVLALFLNSLLAP